MMPVMTEETSAVPYGEDAYSPVTYVVLGIRALIGVVGIVLNWSLVVVTLKTKSLHGTCGILLAIDAMGHSFYETGLIATFTAAVVVGRKIGLSTCFVLQSLSLPAAIYTTPSMLFIALDRLVAVLFPLFFSDAKVAARLVAAIISCFLYAAYVTWRSAMAVANATSKTVICTLSDCYLPELAGEVGRNGTVFHIATIFCYICVWIRLKKIDKDSTIASVVSTRRIFKALSVIILFVTFGLLFNVLALSLLPKFALDGVMATHVPLIISCLPIIYGASHSVVLYVFSHEYRRAFRKMLGAAV